MTLLAENAVGAAVTAETEAAVTVTTAYSEAVIPAITIVMVALGLVMVVGAVIAGLVYTVRHFKNWGPGLMSGVLAQLLFCFLLYVAVLFGLSKIPAFASWSEAHERGYSLLQYLLSFVMDVAGITLGIRYAVYSCEKKMITPDVGLPVAFGVAYLLSTLMEGQQLTYPLQFVMICVSVNQIGFDPAAASLIEGGLSEAEAIESLLSLVNADWVAYICEELGLLCSALTNTCLAVFAYGLFSGKLQKKWAAFAFGGICLYWVPNLLSVAVDIPASVILAMLLVIDAAYVYFLRKALTEELPEEWKKMTSKGTARVRNSRKKEEPPKMPKIKMPD